MKNPLEGDFDMAVAEKVKETIIDARNEELSAIVYDLRAIGDEILKNNPGMCEEENVDFIINQARRISKIL